MSYKIVFFDIDGTLVDEENNIPQSTIDAVEKLHANGLKVVIATGRSPVHIQKVAETLNIDSYICCNGSIVRYEGKGLYWKSIPQESVYQITQNAKENNHPLITFSENNCYSNIEIDPEVQSTYRVTLEKMPIFRPVIPENEDIFQLYLYCKESDQEPYEVDYPQLQFVRYFPYLVDINDKMINKAVGIERVLHHLDISPNQAIAFGDNLNDIEMLSYVGVGVAMGNAIEETKQSADFVTKPINEDGISYALKNLQVI